MKILTAVILTLAVTMPASAAFLDGNTLLEECNASGEKRGGCYGYIIGVADKVNRDHRSLEGRGCTPKSATRGQIIAVAEKHLRNKPEVLHYGADSLVTEALVAAFSCSRAVTYR